MFRATICAPTATRAIQVCLKYASMSARDTVLAMWMISLTCSVAFSLGIMECKILERHGAACCILRDEHRANVNTSWVFSCV